MSSTENPSERAKLRAEAQQVREKEGAEAWAEYRAESLATDEKTARLRALRLAREAEDAAAEAAAPAKPAKAAKKPRKAKA
jgi:hypothetical protein